MSLVDFPVRGTMARPGLLPLFVTSRNNYNPRVQADDGALVVKVVRANRLPYDRITAVRDSWTLFGYALGVTCDGWEYLLHFRTAAERERLRAHLVASGVRAARG